MIERLWNCYTEWKNGMVMEFLKDLAMFVLMAFGIVGWVAIGLIALVTAPFVIGMVLIGAVLFAPDLEGY